MSRVGAGKRAWETRRANELAKKRSEAGKKAAATRKRNAQAKAKATKKAVLVGTPVAKVKAQQLAGKPDLLFRRSL